MPDPGFAAALVAELVHRIIIEAEKAYRCKEYCRSLQSLLKEISPLVTHALTQSTSTQSSSTQAATTTAVDDWLCSLKTVLEDAEKAVQDCTTKNRLMNPFTRYGTATRILKIADKIRSLCVQSPLVVLDVALSIERKLDIGMKQMHDDQRRMELAMATRRAITNVDLNHNPRAKQVAFDNIKKCVDNYVIKHQGNGGTSGSILQPGDDDPAQIRQQIVPQAVFGMDDITAKLKDLVLQDGHGSAPPRTVGIWGKGGAGKTLLAQYIHNDRQVQQHYKTCVIWLTIGRDASIGALYESMSNSLKVSLWASSSNEDSRTILYNELLTRKVLLILDDLWEESLLEWLDIAKGVGSLTLVTSRKQSVLQRANATEFVVLSLSEEDSWKLFSVHAFGGVNKCPVELEPIANLVAEECKGLPLALKVIGGAMVGKTRVGHWKLDLQKLRDSCVLDQNVEIQLFHRMKLSYDELDTIDSRAKQCFVYFAAFPEDAMVDIEYLLHYWIGEKLVGAHGEDPSEDAYCLLEILIGRSLIDLVDCFMFERNFKFKIHDVLRDLALYTLEHQIPAYKRECLFRAGRRLTIFPEEWLGQPLEAKRISLKEHEITTLPDQIQAPQLHTLILEGTMGNYGEPIGLVAIPKQFFGSLNNLMVLDLNTCDLKMLPESIGNLKHLTHLDLSYNMNLVKLPTTIKNLQKLKHLCLKQCEALEYLPLSITKLMALSLLDVESCNRLWQVETTHSNLLKTVASIMDTEELTLDDVGNALSTLEELNISGRSNFPIGPYSFKKMKRLTIRRFEVETLPHAIGRLEEVEELKIGLFQKLSILPPWMENFQQLRVLSLSTLQELKCLPALDKLPLLEYLHIMQCYSLEAIPLSFSRVGSFPSLLSIEWFASTSLRTFPVFEAGAMPKLKIFRADWKYCESLPKFLASCNNLCIITLQGVPLPETFWEVDILSCFTRANRIDIGDRTADEMALIPEPIKALPNLEYKTEVASIRGEFETQPVRI